MLEVIAENKNGQQLRLSNNPYYTLLSVSGVTPPKANINTANLATKDGSLAVLGVLLGRLVGPVVLTILLDGSLHAYGQGLHGVPEFAEI